MYALFTFLVSLPFMISACSSSMYYDVDKQIDTIQQVTSLRNELHCAEPTSSLYMQGEMSCSSQQSSSSTLPFSTALRFEVSNDSNVAVSSSSMISGNAYLFPEAVMLYKEGRIQELRGMGNKISLMQWVSNPHLRMKKDFISTLLKDENKAHLEMLARLLVINTPRRMRVALDEIYKKDRNPVHRFQALRLADKQTGGGNFITNNYLPKKHHVPADGNPGLFVDRDFLAELRREAPGASKFIDAEMAKYTLERYLPAVGSTLTVEAANVYLQQVFDIVDCIDPTQKQEIVTAGVLGLYSRFVSPSATMAEHKDQAYKVSQKIADSLVKLSAKNIGCVPTSIVDLHDDLHWMVQECPADQLAYKVGQRIGDSAYLIAYAAGLRYAIMGINSVGVTFTSGGITQAFSLIGQSASKGEAFLSAAVKIASAEELARGIVNIIAEQQNCVLSKDKDGVENWDCQLNPGQNPLDIFKKIEGLGEMVEKSSPKGAIYTRAIDAKNTANCRDFSKSFGKDASTIEFQIPDRKIKMRFPHTFEAFTLWAAKNNLEITGLEEINDGI